MYRSSDGGGIAARLKVYRLALVRVLISVLGPLPAGRGSAPGGWSPVAVALGAILMSLDAGPTLSQRFESSRSVLDAALPRRRKVGRTFQGFIRSLSRHSAALLGLVVPRLRERTREAAGKDRTFRRFVPIGADSSKIDAPRTLANEALGLAGKDATGPQMVLLLLFHLGAMLPWAYKVGGARDAERTLLRSMLGVLPTGEERTLLVMDAGFTGFDLLSDIIKHKISFLVRVGANVHLLTSLGSYRREGKHTVHLWPDSKHDQPPLRLRLIRVGSAWLVTDVTDPRELGKKDASELYRRRWGVEVAFRSLKQTLERRKVRSCTPAHARTELAWSVIGMWTLMLAGASALRKGCGPRRLSVAGTLAAVRHAMHTPMSDRTLKRRLRRCLIDERRRKAASKKARNWPHKKTQKPPGEPRITIATRAQVEAAKELRSRKLAT